MSRQGVAPVRPKSRLIWATNFHVNTLFCIICRSLILISLPQKFSAKVFLLGRVIGPQVRRRFRRSAIYRGYLAADASPKFTTPANLARSPSDIPTSHLFSMENSRTRPLSASSVFLRTAPGRTARQPSCRTDSVSRCGTPLGMGVADRQAIAANPVTK